MKTLGPLLLFLPVLTAPVSAEITFGATPPPTAAAAPLSPFAASAVNALTGAVAPLKNPVLSGARECVDRLDALAATDSTGAFERLSGAVRQLFTAEFRHFQARQRVRERLDMARKKRVWAADYLRPNALGSIRTESARRCLEEEKECLAQAEALERGARPAMAEAIQAMDFQLSRVSPAADGALLTLVQAMHAVKARTLPDAELPLRFSAHWLAVKRMSPEELEGARRQAVVRLGNHLFARYRRCHAATGGAWTFTGLQPLRDWTDSPMRDPLVTLLPDAPPLLQGAARSFLIELTENGHAGGRVTVQTGDEAMREAIRHYLQENCPDFAGNAGAVESLAQVAAVMRSRAGK